jgi:hypothetical protein
MDVRWKNNFESSTAHGANALSPGRRVVVELEGILYDDSAFERWLFQLLVRMGIRSSFDRFHTEWRHDYVADITTGTGSLDAALRRFLPTFGMSTGTIHEVCAAAVCRHRQLSCQPVLFPGVAGPIVQLARWGVCWTAVHRSTRSLKDWERTLHKIGRAHV